MMFYNPKIDTVNDNVYTKLGLILSLHSQDIKQQSNYSGLTEKQRG